MLLFTPEGQIPAGAGFSMFGWQHLLMLSVLESFTVLSLLWMRRLHAGELNRLLRILGGVMLGLEVLKDFILAEIGAFSVGYLPLHLCSLAMFVCMYYGAHPESNTCGQILYSVCFPGAMCALLFPDWTMFPILHFQSIHSFVYHTLLVQVSLAPVVTGRVRPGLKHVWKSMAFLVAVALPVGLMNRLLHTNYMFLGHPSAGSPLELLGNIPGKYGYLAGYFLLVLLVEVGMNLPWSILTHKGQKNKRRKYDAKN